MEPVRGIARFFSRQKIQSPPPGTKEHLGIDFVLLNYEELRWLTGMCVAMNTALLQQL